MIAASAGVSAEVVVLATSALLFALGVTGLLVRRNPIAVLMSVELMLNAGNLLLVMGARVRDHAGGASAALLVLVLGAAEAVVGLALALAFFRTQSNADVDAQGEVHG